MMLTNSSVRMRPELAALFVPGVSVAAIEGSLGLADPMSARPAGLPPGLTQAEYQSISHCAPKRIDDYSRGRACAHEVLQTLGAGGMSILSGPHREPLWPAGLVGSITHTTGFAAAAIARQDRAVAVGIDCEEIQSVKADLWSHVCTPAERDYLAGLSGPEQQQAAALIFATKEALYKCQFPLTRAWVGFQDVSIVLPSGPWELVQVGIVPQTRLPLSDLRVGALIARACFREGWVIAGVSLPQGV